MEYTMEQYQASAKTVRERLGDFVPKVAMVLGSGLGYLGDEVETPLPSTIGTFPTLRPLLPPGTRAGWCSAPWRAKKWL